MATSDCFLGLFSLNIFFHVFTLRWCLSLMGRCFLDAAESHVKVSVSSNSKLSPNLWLSLKLEAPRGCLDWTFAISSSTVTLSYGLNVAPLWNSCCNLSPIVAYYEVGPSLPSGMERDGSFLIRTFSPWEGIATSPFRRHRNKAQGDDLPQTPGALIWG